MQRSSDEHSASYRALLIGRFFLSGGVTDASDHKGLAAPDLVECPVAVKSSQIGQRLPDAVV
ncbi:hypothetical protein [Bradyrhizobium sp. NP1]|uniref:hypothetical protein n=1 Tax=Bradyrhizobium sp. NP1 TaxID=3049772 RepID=UPI0025A67083|nr:hypothetical protein [Bradyrhizobium sp. NP1]WJR77222.1 hypothetical protein QOU61_31555 [Bradyrhizobium sp. NP1]